VQKKLLLRMLLCLVIGIVLAAVGRELAFHFQGQNTSRAAGTIELIIPEGTALKVAEVRASSQPAKPLWSVIL